MMNKEKLESYRHLFTTSEDDTADDIIDSHLEALEKIEWLKTVINNIVEQIPLAILDRPLK